ncbi:beta-galactosidase [Cryobacterium sp. PAMC25264]|uniref:beta-galactosidase n=1 Tax=Cryobacterium sp. PAMC25264 TaxID=2861288 RepID=UPI001C62CA2D|nr:beta-galactosidase [Cryobacterium sp. PAMC25264]QYF73387.1 beta-galactosidase [Cryobacterium sp. PAMC25264]
MTDFVSRSADLPTGSRFPWIADGFALGGDYSPEQWPESVWIEDIALMRQAGVNSLNVGVFSWGLLETADGVFDWGWLDRIMDLLADAGIGVNLATPTAAPPIWLLQAHPEIAPVTQHGVRHAQGGRLGWHPSSAVFRRYALRMVEALATRYATHPALKLWHVSNELGNENAHSYDDETGRAWQVWLERKFGSIDLLNDAWGSAFWGHHYTSFDQLQPPRFTSTSHNPALLLDFERFTSDALLGHYQAEREVLRRITPGIPVTTNFMVQNHPNGLDYARWADEVDLVANDHYTMGTDPETYGELAFSADRVRGMSGGAPWLLIEHSTSAVNWQPRNRAKAVGELARNSLAHIARGADGALFFQWRQSTAGSEQFHSSVVPHAGADTKIFREVTALGATLRNIREVVGSRVQTSQLAILFDYDAAMALRSGAKPSVDVNSLDVALTMHRELTARGIQVDIVHPSVDLTGYRAVLAPTLFLLTEADAARLTAYVTGGGHLVVTSFSGIVTEHNRVIEGGYPGALRDLLGVRVEEFFPLFAGDTVTVTGEITAGPWTGSVWSELLQTSDQPDGSAAAVVARYADGELAGLPAITLRPVGAGTAQYVSTHLDRPATGALLELLIERAGITPVAPADRGLELVRRVAVAPEGATEAARWLFAINHSAGPLRLDASGLDLVTGERFAPGASVAAGAVAVIREDPSA